MDIEETKKFCNKIEGFMLDKEGELLFNLAKNCKGKGAIVEIGSWKGKSTIWLANGSKNGNNVKIYAIDHHIGSSEHKIYGTKIQTFQQFKQNIKKAKVEDIVFPIVKTSKEASENFSEDIEFIFIDGAHEYEYVKLDFDLWFPKVLDDGIMAFHDTLGWIGPKKFVKNYIYKSKYFKNVRFVGSITFAKKVRINTFIDRIENRKVLLVKDLYEFLVKLKLPKIIRKLLKSIFKKIHYSEKG